MSSFGKELENAGGAVVKSAAKTASIGLGIITFVGLTFYFGGKYVKSRRNLKIANKSLATNQKAQTEAITVASEEWS